MRLQLGNQLAEGLSILSTSLWIASRMNARSFRARIAAKGPACPARSRAELPDLLRLDVKAPVKPDGGGDRGYDNAHFLNDSQNFPNFGNPTPGRRGACFGVCDPFLAESHAHAPA